MTAQAPTSASPDVYAGAGSRSAPGDTGLRVLLKPCLWAGQSADTLQVVAEEEVRIVVPSKAELTPVETPLLPALIRLSGIVINALLRRLREVLGPSLLRWGCLKEFEGEFFGRQ